MEEVFAPVDQLKIVPFILEVAVKVAVPPAQIDWSDAITIGFGLTLTVEEAVDEHPFRVYKAV
jgi:hypothetical protein